MTTLTFQSRIEINLRYFAGLKSPQAQHRNWEKAIDVLSGGQARFMARDWNSEA